MKLHAYILIIVLFLLSFLPLKSVFAAADNSFATTTLQSFVGVLIELGTPFGFNIADYIHPIYKKRDQIPTTKYKPFADFKTTFSTRLMPDYFRANGKIKDWTEPIIWSSLYCAVLKTSAPHGKPVEPIRALSSGAQESSEVPDAGRAFQQAVTINSLIGLYEKEPNADGVLDFDKPSRIVATISTGDCWRDDPNIEWNKIPNDQTELSTFGGDAEIWSEMAETILITTIELINKIWTTVTKCCESEQAHNIVILTEKKKTDHSQNNCHDSAHPCPANDIGDETVGLDVSGGWSAGFTPYFITQIPVEPNAGLEYEIEVLGMTAGNITDSDKDFNIGADGQKKASCAVVPAKDKNADYQAIIKIGGEVDLECGPPVVKEPETCDSPFFSQLKPGIEYSQQGRAADAGYTLPYRDASQSLTETMKTAAKELAVTGYSGGSKATENIDLYWYDINETAKKNGWNPIFIVALWIEESAAGGHPNASHDLGCLYGWDKPNAQGPAVSMPRIGEGNICNQMACLFSHPVKDKNDFNGFMCSYNSDDTSVNQYQCQASNGWPFPQRLKLVYDILINAK